MSNKTEYVVKKDDKQVLAVNFKMLVLPMIESLLQKDFNKIEIITNK